MTLMWCCPSSVIFFSLVMKKGGRGGLPGGCIRQGKVRRVQERARRATLGRVIGKRAVSDIGQQDRHPLCSLGRRATLPHGSDRTHHRQGQGQPYRLRGSTT